MASFTLLGYVSASAIAIALQTDNTAVPGWAAALQGGENISVEIARFDGLSTNDLVAPCSLWFTSANITGALGVNGQPISEPAGDTNAYDPTAIELFHSWGFGDPGYQPLVQPNVPLFMRDVNRAFTKRPNHVMHTPGVKTVTLFVYDTRGNWGTANPYTFGPGGQAPAIADPATHFTGRDIYFSVAGNFDLVPAGVPLADRCTSVSAVNSRVTTLVPNAGVVHDLIRIRLRRGEVYTDIGGDLGNFRNIYFDSYGDPLAAPPLQVRTGDPAGGAADGPFAPANGALGSPRIIDQDWQGPYDAATETGRRVEALLRNSSRNGRRLLLHRVRMSGMTFYFDALQPDAFRTYSDVSITNWQDYGMFLQSERMTLGIIGGDFAQHVDALGGTHHGVGNSNFANLTNRHGPMRHGTTRDLYVACSSFLSRNGWSQRSGPGAGNTTSGTLGQACYRHGGIGNLSIRNYSAWERCSFEGGAGAVDFVDLGGGGQSVSYQGNVLFDGNLRVAATDVEAGFRGKGKGMSARNNYFFVPAVPHEISNPRHVEQITWSFNGAVDLADPSRTFVFNNTTYILANNAQIGVAASRVTAAIAADHNPVIENNVLFAPALSPAIGTGLGTFATPTLSGFTPRYKGVRFNFPPIGHPYITTAATPGAVFLTTGVPYGPSWYLLAENFRVGGAGPVANNEQISLPYPNYTGLNNGALTQVTRAMVESVLPVSGAARFHQISLHFLNVKAAAPASAGGDGRVAFTFTDTAILVQNLSGIAWTGPFWVLLDLRDRLMDFIPGTANPASIPALVPGAGPLVLGAQPDLWPRVDFRQIDRPAGGPHIAGAWQAAPV